MGKVKHFAWLLMPLFMACFSTDPASTKDEVAWGTIKGRVVQSPSNPSMEGRSPGPVYIYGTNFLAYPDTSGNFALYFVPVGEYTVEFQLQKHLVRVMGNDTAVVPDFYFDWYGDLLAFKVEHQYLDQTGYHSGRNTYTPPWFRDSLITFSDSMSLVFQLVHGYDSPIETTLTVSYGENVLYNSLSMKGRVLVPRFPVGSGGNLNLMIGSDTLGIYLISRPGILSGKTVVISIDSVIDTTRGWGNFVITGNYTSYFEPIPYSHNPIDLDLYLINLATRDTCYWRTPNPDWGIIGTTADDCDLRDDYVGVSHGEALYSSSLRSSYYRDENISCNQFPAGTYKLLVKYSDAISPGLMPGGYLVVSIGSTPYSYMLDKFISIQIPATLEKGQFWEVGTFRMPEGVLDTTHSSIR